MPDISRKVRFTIDLNAPLVPGSMQGILMEGDKMADTLEITLKDGETAVTASDIVQAASAKVNNTENQTIENVGDVDDMISITLMAESYAVPGSVTIDVVVAHGDTERTILTMSGYVQPNGRGVLIDASNALPSYSDLIIIKQEMQAATQAATDAKNAANTAAGAANTAANAANAATSAANNAATSANSAAGAANDAADRVNGYLDDLPVPDDTQASTSHPWSGAKTKQEITNAKNDLFIPQNYEYSGRDLSTIFTAAQLHEAVVAGNFSQIRNGDYWPITLNGTIKDYATGETKTLNNAIFKLEANIQVYKQYGDTPVPNHILFCSRDLLPWTLMFRSENTTWYDTVQTNPWLGSHLYQTLNAADGILPLVAATDIGAYIYGGPNGKGMRFLAETKAPGATSATSWAWSDRGKLFLPSEREVWGADTWSEHSYGGGLALQWPVFAGSMRHIIKGFGNGGSRCAWWCCSSRAGTSGSFCFADGSGLPIDTSAAYIGVGAPLCFLFV